MPVNPQVKNAVLAGFLAALGLVAYGVLTPATSDHGTVAVIDWPDGGRPAPGQTVACITQIGYSSDPGCMALLGLDAGRARYGRVDACAVIPEDGGPPQGEALPSCFTVLEDTQLEVPWDGGPMIASYLEHELLGCACSTGSDCEMLRETMEGSSWQEAWVGNTLERGKWRGDGCYPTVCVQLAGVPDWPEECPR